MENKVIILSGLTSVGKSAVSLELCKYLNAEIVVADSVQVYKGFDIGANKPTAEEQQLVPHHMIDICDPCVNYNTADFSRKAADIIHDIIKRNKTPIVVGGSTMWIQWLTQGVPDAPAASQEAVQKVKTLIDGYEAAGEWDKAIEILQQYDPSRIEKFSPNDWYRLKRNLEICIDRQLTPSSFATESPPPALTGARTPLLSPDLDVRCFFLTEDREDLYNTIDTRCLQMLLDGFANEVGELLVKDQLSLAFPNWKSIGYRQTIEFLCNETLPEKELEPFVQFLTEFATATRNYSRRQYAWYKRDTNFLFLKIRRASPLSLSSSSSSKQPENKKKQHREKGSKSYYNTPKFSYLKVAEEIAHWLTIPKDEFQQRITHQLQQAQAFGKFHKRISMEYIPTTTAETEVIGYLLSSNDMKLRSPGAHGEFNDTTTSKKKAKKNNTTQQVRKLDGQEGGEMSIDAVQRQPQEGSSKEQLGQQQDSEALSIRKTDEELFAEWKARYDPTGELLRESAIPIPPVAAPSPSPSSSRTSSRSSSRTSSRSSSRTSSRTSSRSPSRSSSPTAMNTTSTDTATANAIISNETAEHWTAKEVTIRVGDLKNAMKLYQSKLIRGDFFRYLPIVEEVDKWRKYLWSEKRSLMEAFAKEMKKDE